MGRWEPNAGGRLQEAAFALFSERGYEQTTAAEIAKRAGLTERTFFRHFADKREVLFAGGAMLADLMATAVADAPADLAPMDLVAAALAAAGHMFDERREGSRRRQAIIEANPELRERELIKLDSLGARLTDALRQRGVSPISANLAAEVGIAVFRVAFARWIKDSEPTRLSVTIERSLAELKAVTGGS
jgi:AcrR family transcriptional regulator